VKKLLHNVLKETLLMRTSYDAVIIGAGPNGLAAAITLVQAGRTVIVFAAQDTVGGGVRTQELTLPGFHHDVCAAIHPFAAASPFFRTLPLERYGLEWVHPTIPLAHPLDDGTAVLLERSVTATGESSGCDARAYEQLMTPLVAQWEMLVQTVLGPLRIRPLLRHALALAPFGIAALSPAQALADGRFRGERARALFAGLCAHAQIPLNQPISAAAGLMLGVAGHAHGWPFPHGGAQRLTDALVGYLRSLGGEIATGVEVKALDELPQAQVVLCDITPRQLLRIAGHRLPEGYRRSLRRFRYGPGSFKIDFALDGPVPWKAQDCLRAGTVHVGGTLAEIASGEAQVARGVHPERPYVLVAQQSLFDALRAPEGQQTLWAYCHVPHGSTFDMTERIEAQIERFAPGFRERILARHVLNPADLERYNANYVGGDINGGIQDMWQFFTRPTLWPAPYTTPAKNIYLCSSSTPPGGGVHGLCGYFAAQAALKRAW
jgi:phytoene dehydrogenase-like protein